MNHRVSHPVGSADRLRRRTFVVGAVAAVAGLVSSSARADEPPSPASPEFAYWVMNRVDDMHRGTSSHAIMQMTVKTRHWTRTLEMESWTRGKDHSLVRILAPKKERGTATLKAKDDLFTYLNKTGRTIKISGAMMSGAWMGSHLSNDDLVKAARMADHYAVALTKMGTLEGVPQYVFTATPRPDAPVVWGKVEVTIRQDDLLPTRQVFYDEDGKAVRAMQFEDYRTLGGRTFAGRMIVRPLDGSGEYTQLVFRSIDFDVEVPERYFTLQYLKSL
jgi:hypothetical protein